MKLRLCRSEGRLIGVRCCAPHDAEHLQGSKLLAEDCQAADVASEISRCVPTNHSVRYRVGKAVVPHVLA
jgi:hypothetical protein